MLAVSVAPLDIPRQPTLFPLPAAVPSSPPPMVPDAADTPFVTASAPLWVDLDASPVVTLRKLPTAADALRTRLRDGFDPGQSLPHPFGQRTHDLGQQLLPLLRKVSYTQALVDGAFRLFIEYRTCDKFPHFRLMWGHVLWGRVDIRAGNASYGADIRLSPALPFVLERLADYLIALGFRLGSARLRVHDSEMDDTYHGDVLYERDVKTDTREWHLFKIDIELERKRVTQLQKQAEAYALILPPKPTPRSAWHTLEAWGGTWPRWMVAGSLA